MKPTNEEIMKELQLLRGMIPTKAAMSAEVEVLFNQRFAEVTCTISDMKKDIKKHDDELNDKGGIKETLLIQATTQKSQTAHIKYQSTLTTLIFIAVLTLCGEFMSKKEVVANNTPSIQYVPYYPQKDPTINLQRINDEGLPPNKQPEVPKAKEYDSKD
jgi:hypothetical protein